LSLQIYVDDCVYDKRLVTLLRAAGHQVTTPADAGLTAASDPAHFKYAQAHNLVLLTKNPDDFVQLHAADQSHAGILLIYQDNDPGRDMTFAEIVRAVKNLEDAGIVLQGSCIALNAWRY
jgi:predicted nuclease of predicted toxin-antitoxin system